MTINSKKKGSRGEREVRDILRRYGYQARRGQQYAGSPDSPDVKHNIPNVHIEVKRTESLSLYKAIEQANADKGKDEIALIAHKRNRKEWLAILSLDDLLDLIVQIYPPEEQEINYNELEF